MYLDGKGAELATSGDVGVQTFVTVGDLIDVGVPAETGVIVDLKRDFVTDVVGEPKSNDKRDLFWARGDGILTWMILHDKWWIFCVTQRYDIALRFNRNIYLGELMTAGGW